MCETCEHFSSLNRRDFLKIGGSAVAMSALWGAGAIAQTPNRPGSFQPIAKKRTKITTVFMYPPPDVVNEGRLEDSWAVNNWFTYPGNQFEPEKNHQKFRQIIEEASVKYGFDTDFAGVLYTKAQVASFVEKMNAAPPDALLIVNFWHTFSPWVLEMTEKMPLPTIIYHPVGSNHQHPPRGLMAAPGVVYIHSIENREALENALIAVNVKKQMEQSRLLRITTVEQPTVAKDANLGIEMVAIPAAEYNTLFDSISADNALVSEAMAFKAKANAVIDVEDRYIVDGFRSCRAVKEIMRRYNADGITINCLMLKERKPCIAFSQFNGALIPCACEDFFDSAMTLMFATQLFQRGGFQHNPDFDVDRNQYYGSHCTCALEMHGPGKGTLPFRIRPFTHQLPKTAALDVRMMTGERAVLTKYIPPENKLIAYTGAIAGNPEINVAGGCATRFVMDIDKTDDVCSIYHGPHPILYFSSKTEANRLKMFAKLAKLEFVGNF
jgi:hypothetical protein